MSIRLKGIAAIFVDETDQILILRELRGKKGIKKQNQFSIPMETLEVGEDPCEGILRMIEEEIGVVDTYGDFKNCGVFYLPIGEKVFAKIELFIIKVRSYFISPCDTDIVDHKFLYLEEILNLDLRPAAREMLLRYNGDIPNNIILCKNDLLDLY